MSIELCKLKRSIKGDLPSYILLVNQPRFVCVNCGRAANKKKNLCNPERISAKR